MNDFLIKSNSNSTTVGDFFGKVERETTRLYKIEETNAYDPSIIYRRGPYDVDNITCETLLSPAEYISVTNALKEADSLTLDFYIGEDRYTFDITYDKLPKMSDDGRLNVSKYTFIFKSMSHSKIIVIGIGGGGVGGGIKDKIEAYYGATYGKIF